MNAQMQARRGLEIDLRRAMALKQFDLSSANGMNRAGETGPRSGWFQRSSASKPVTSPLSSPAARRRAGRTPHRSP
jgi:hypothetical protein